MVRFKIVPHFREALALPKQFVLYFELRALEVNEVNRILELSKSVPEHPEHGFHEETHVLVGQILVPHHHEVPEHKQTDTLLLNKCRLVLHEEAVLADKLHMIRSHLHVMVP